MFTRIILRTCLIILLLIGSTSCSYKFDQYHNPTLPDHLAAHVKFNIVNYNISSGSIILNGDQIAFMSSRLDMKIKPGTYTFLVKYNAEWDCCASFSDPCQKLYSAGTCSTTLNFEQGKRYYLEIKAKHKPGFLNHCSIPHNRWLVFSETTQSNTNQTSNENYCNEISTSYTKPLFF